MSFILSGLSPDPFLPLFGLTDAKLEERHARRLVAEPGYPCRVTLADAEPGESVLLVTFMHQLADSPFRASGPIFVRESARERRVASTIPESFRPSLFSARAYDSAGMIIDADVAKGAVLEQCIERFFAQPDVDYIHLHYARRGCYACRVDRS
ncbi:DUF1203 domain-containing protein [Allosphingosinicella humi]